MTSSSVSTYASNRRERRIMKLGRKFRIGNFIHTISFQWRRTFLEKPVIGTRSNLDRLSVYNSKSKHLLMLDFDNLTPLKKLIGKIRTLQMLFRLGDCYIYESSRRKETEIIINKKFPFIHNKIIIKSKYHGYFYQDALNYFECCRIIHFATNILKIVDEAYARWRMIRPNMVLRFSPKKDDFVPRFICKINSPYPKSDVKWFKDMVEEFIEQERRRVEFHRHQ